MNTQQLLEIQPTELRFSFQLKKQSSCAVRLTNNTYDNLAFKVKTTSPKKYCVRPNVGVIPPKSICEFTVTMQAPKAVPLEMTCKDKFLIQSTVVPLGTTDIDITPDMFSKDEGRYVEEVKLKVALISPPESPVLSPINGVRNQGPFLEPSVVQDPMLSRLENSPPQHLVAKNVGFKMLKEKEHKMDKHEELKPKETVIIHDESKPKETVIIHQESRPALDARVIQNNVAFNGAEVHLMKDGDFKQEKDAINVKWAKVAEPPPPMNAVKNSFNDELEHKVEYPVPIMKDTFNFGLTKDAEFPSPRKPVKDAFDDKLAKEEKPPVPKNEENDVEFMVVKAANELKLVSEVEEMKYKVNLLKSELNEAESTISKLTEERRLNIQERKMLQEELTMLRSRTTTSTKNAQVGFPLLFVVMVALVSVYVGYLLHY